VFVEPDIIFGAFGYPTSISPGGDVFALTRPRRPSAEWDIEYLFAMSGFFPVGAVVAGAHGVIFGASAVGGTRDCGTVWQLTPPAAAGGKWTEKILHDFQNGADGCNPASIGPGIGGVLYGTTTAGGSGRSPGNGTVFKIVP
jgi:uncharacterized repeat protein (TIGR03803 family)